MAHIAIIFVILFSLLHFMTDMPKVCKQPVLATQCTNCTVTTVIIKVIYKMIPHVILQFSFSDGDNWKADVNNWKGIQQLQKMTEIRVPVQVTGVKIVFKFQLYYEQRIWCVLETVERM